MGDLRPDDAILGEVDAVFEGYKKHCSAPYKKPDLAITEIIRSVHPNCNVITVDKYDCDFEGYGKAGHAKVALHTERNRFVLERAYQAPSNRLEDTPGQLSDKVRFGGYDISWNGQSWIFYVATWSETYMGVLKKQFLVSRKDDPSNSPDDLLLAVGKWTSELHDEIYVFDDASWDKNSKLWAAVQSSTWDDVILDPAMKDMLIADVQNFFDNRALYNDFAVPWRRGIILHGTPGCGKTISIKALMNSLDKRERPVASLYVKSLKSSCNTMQYSIRYIFSKAREMAPCMLVFEDLDSLVVDEVRSYFLNEVDGLEDNNGILMIGSTNHLERLDPGIAKRPSRFDRKYFFKLPGTRERVLYCEYWKKKLEKNSSVDFDPAISDVVAKLTEGFSFAYMKELFVQTLLMIVGGRTGGQQDSDDEVVVVSASDDVTMGDEEEKEKDDEKKDEKKSDGPQPPVVEIPEHLKDNRLMQVLQQQALALWRDMDNTNDEEAGVKVEKKDTDEADEDYRCQIAMLKHQNRARKNND